jgi:hypothetical protein
LRLIPLWHPGQTEGEGKGKLIEYGTETRAEKSRKEEAGFLEEFKSETESMSRIIRIIE